MQFSYWEYKQWFSKVDYCIIGSGIVGLNSALELRKTHPNSKILLLERGVLPNGASTKNAGFACFGSVSEILADLNNHSEEKVVSLVKRRLLGLKILRENLGDKSLGLKQKGGYEIFLQNNPALYNTIVERLDAINQLLYPIFQKPVFHLKKDIFGFGKCYKKLIYNPFEAQIDTGKMMAALLSKVRQNDILVLSGVEVTGFESKSDCVDIVTSKFNFTAKNLLIATNGFANQLLDVEVKPARAQVLVTEPIPNLKISGTFHIEQGYYYFRNIDQRILLGGGRNLDFYTETTNKLELNQKIQNQLDDLLHEVVLPNQKVSIAQRWTGIMGIGNSKEAIVKKINERVGVGVRLGGMGVAIGSLVGKELANLFVSKSK